MEYKFFVILLIIAGFTSTLQAYSDDNISKKSGPNSVTIAEPVSNEKAALTIGVLQGGGSLIGADLEFLVSKTVGVQFGAGLLGYGAGLNFHFKPAIRSSFICLGYWHQGIGESFAQSVGGATFVFRAKKIFTAQIGMGYKLANGPAMTDKYRDEHWMLLYSIGIYFPLD